MKITRYTDNNINEITQLFTTVFSNSEGQSEGLLVGNLAHTLLTDTASSDFDCFIATHNEKIIGSIIFSRLLFNTDINAFILLPVTIDTEHQRQGGGQDLIHFGLKALKEKGVELVFTYGDPGFNSKVGFQTVAENRVKAPLKLTYPEGWLGQLLVSDEIKAKAENSYCVDALNLSDYWYLPQAGVIH